METSFTTQLTERDYKRAFWETLLQRAKFWLSVGWWVLTLAIILHFFVNGIYSILFAVAAVLAWIILFHGYNLYRYRKAVRQANRLFEKIDWVISRDALLGKGATFESKIPFAKLSKVQETRHYLALWVTEGWYTLLPKNELPDTVLEELRYAVPAVILICFGINN